LLFTDNGNGYFTEQAVADLAASLAPLGKPAELRQNGIETPRRHDPPPVPGGSFR